MYSVHTFWIPKGAKFSVRNDDKVTAITIELPYPSGTISFHFDETTITLEDFIKQIANLKAGK